MLFNNRENNIFINVGIFIRYEISHVIYCLPWNIIITFQWFTFITKQFPHILTNYLKSHYTGIFSKPPNVFGKYWQEAERKSPPASQRGKRG